MTKKEGMIWLFVVLMVNASTMLDSIMNHKPWLAMLSLLGVVVVAMRMGILIQEKDHA